MEGNLRLGQNIMDLILPENHEIRGSRKLYENGV